MFVGGCRFVFGEELVGVLVAMCFGCVLVGFWLLLLLLRRGGGFVCGV